MKFRYYENYNVKKLNIVVKYTKARNKSESFITKDGFKTDQRVYTGRSFKGLITYLKKEGNNFYTKKPIDEKTGVKHLIISPISPELYNKLDDKQKQKLKDIIVKRLFKDYSRYGFFGAIEHKKRGELDHFHIHLAINSKFDIGLKNITYLKRHIAQDIFKNPDLRKSLELKSPGQLKRKTYLKTYFNKNKELYKEKINTYNNISFLFGEMLNINNNVKYTKNLIFEDITLLKLENKEKRNQLNRIYKKQEFIIDDIKDTKEILKLKKDDLQTLNKFFNNTLGTLQNQKNNVIKLYTNEIKNLQLNMQNELFYFKNYLQNEKNIYVYFLKQQLKNGEIDLPTFLFLVSSNTYYQKQRILYKKEYWKQLIKSKRQQLKNKIKNINTLIKREIENYKLKKHYKELSIEYDNKKIKNLINKLNNLNNEKNNTINNFNNRIELIKEYLQQKQQILNKLLQQQKQKQLEIQKEKLKLNNINNKINNNYIHDLEKKYNYKLNPIEIEQVKKEFEKDKKQFPELKFKNYLEAHIKQQIKKQKEQQTINNKQKTYRNITL